VWKVSPNSSANPIVLDCTGGIPTLTTASIPQVNFTVFLNTNVTSRIYDAFNGSEALLVVDEPGTTQNPSPLTMCASAASTTLSQNGCTFTGTSTVSGTPGIEPYNGTGTGAAIRANVYRGIVNGNQVQFVGVPVDPPGSTGHRIFRFTNIRANASAISIGTGIPGSIQALVSASGSTSVPINNPTQIVGIVQQGMVFTSRNRGDYTSATNLNTNIGIPQCNNLSRTGSAGNFILEFKENFPTAFKVRGTQSQSVPGNIYNTESGFTSPLLGSGSYGYADAATRVKATFNNVPAGVNVWASLGNYRTASMTGDMKLVSGEYGGVADQIASFTDFVTPTGFSATVANGGFASSTSSSAAAINVVNGTATAVWEVTGANALSSDSYYVAVWFSWTGNAQQNSPAPGTATVSGGFAPTNAAVGATNANYILTSTSLPIPRFVDSSTSRAILVVYLCRTNLLFPFVTNQAGFDTGMAIANTSLDTGLFFQNTPGQAGACNLYSFGDNAPASFSTGSIAAGKVWVDLASSKMPNFQGYVFAQCAFQFAHGFAFVSDFGARNLAMGYLALVVPEPGNTVRAASPLSLSTAGAGEQLGN